MKRDFTIDGITFHVGNITPRNNEFERGIKYGLFVEYERFDGSTYDVKIASFSTIREAKQYAMREAKYI